MSRPSSPGSPWHGYSAMRDTNSIGGKCSLVGCRHPVTAKGAKSYCSSGGHYGEVQRFGSHEMRRAWNLGVALSILTRRGEQAFVYLLEFVKLMKIGRTVDPATRYRDHERIAGPVVAEHHLEWVSEAPALESYCLREAARRGIAPVSGREWFSLEHLPFFKRLLEPIA